MDATTTKTTPTTCDECGETPVAPNALRDIDNAKRCGRFCYRCVPARNHRR